MSKLWLLKLIHDADGQFSVDDLADVTGLELLFELQNAEYIAEEPDSKLWGVTDLGMYRLEIEDHSTSELQKLGTPAQVETVGRMAQFGWKPSHLWEYENDLYAVWMIAPNPTKSGSFTHGYVMPDGKLERYENKVRIGVQAKEEQMGPW